MQIPLSGERIAFARLFPGRQIGIYKYFSNVHEAPPNAAILASQEFIFIVTLSRYVITKGIFKIFAFKPLTEKEVDALPPSFTQDIVDINVCTIFYVNDIKPQRKASPVECIGLEPSAVWQEQHVIKRIEDYLENRKNFSVELHKIILSENDIRYLAGPYLRWDGVREEFYRITEKQLNSERMKYKK